MIFKNWEKCVVQCACCLGLFRMGDAPAQELRVLCFGDSITHRGTWVQSIDADESIHAINAGRSGRRVSQAEAEFPPYLAKYPNLDRIILFLGSTIGPPKVNPKIMDEVNLKKGCDITSPLLEDLGEGYENLAKEKGAQFLSLYKVVSWKNYKDGPHPNHDGDR